MTFGDGRSLSVGLSSLSDLFEVDDWPFPNRPRHAPEHAAPKRCGNHSNDKEGGRGVGGASPCIRRGK